MLRQSLLYLSGNPTARRLVTETSISRKLAARFVAGDTLPEAVRCARELNQDGLTVSLDYLGEAVSSREEAVQATEMAVQSLERIAANEIRGNVSVKPTQLGLDIDTSFCLENLERILGYARNLGDGEGSIFVRLDMESSPYIEPTIGLVEELWSRGYRNVGTVVQSYMHRTLSDIRRLNEIGSRVRLVKGAYREPPQIAYPEKSRVDHNFIEGMKLLLSEGTYPAIATHDPEMITATRHYAFERGIDRKSFEFQMLYGVRRDLQQRLIEEGYNVRIYLPFGDSWYPYLMRRLAERPANVLFLAGSVVKESPAGRLARPGAIGAGLVAGVLAGMKLRESRRNGHR